MILDKIVNDTRQYLELKKRGVPLDELRKRAARQSPALSLAQALAGDDVRLIAEVKKASPSGGVICANFDPVRIASVYARNGAAAISVLTEPRYFQGSLEYLAQIGQALGPERPPLLRKDFIFDPYQVYESRANGADALLLIVSVLGERGLKALLDLSHELGMTCLVETHNEAEVRVAVASGAKVIGINNRDLTDFTIDLNTTGRLRAAIPGDRIVVSESGIKTRTDMARLRGWGVNAALVGESLVASGDIAARMKELL